MRGVNTSPFCEQDEAHQLGDQLSKQPFNILANKRLKKARPLVTESRDSITRINRHLTIRQDAKEKMEVGESRENSLKKVSELLQGAKHSNHRFSTFQTHFSSHSRGKQTQKLKMNQTVSVKRSSLSGAEPSGKLSESSLERHGGQGWPGGKGWQGGLKQKHLMNWLNQILTEYCFPEPLQQGPLKALERFGLDETTLLSRGMRAEDSARLYKMLFVYSMGLNSALKQVGARGGTLKAVWKVYAVLLEYCSAGKFQTMMGELERDAMKNEERLIREIQKRQEQIDNNQEIMEERLHRYSKENKQLTARVRSLQEKNEVLQKEFRQMQMAYNMQVSLRLAYQYKINEIYSVHQKLNILHLNMYKQLQEKTAEGKKAKQECWQAKQTAGELKADCELLTGHMADLRNALTLHENLVEGLRMNEHQLREKLHQEQSIKRQQVVELREREKRIQQLQREVGSGNLMVGIMKSAADSHLQEYRRLMLQNSDLRRISQSQLEKISELLSDIKYLNSKESTLKSELAHSEAKIKELQQRLADTEAAGEQLSRQLQKKQIQLRTKCVQYDSQKKLADSMEANMKQINIIHTRLEEEYAMNQKYGAEMSRRYEVAHQRIMALELEVKAIQEQKFQVELDLSRRTGDLLALKKKAQADADQQQRQYDKLHKLWSGQDESQSSLAQQLAACQAELQTANIRISFLSQKFTDINFQKSKIEALYHDNLVLHDKQKDAQKNLLIQISTLTDDLEQARRQVELTTKTSQQQLDRLSKEKSQVEALLRKREAALKKKEGFVHPMLLEDALQTLKRQIEKHYLTRVTLENQVEKEQEKNQSLLLELQKKQADFRNQVKELQKRVDKARSDMQGERQYFQSKSEQLNAMIYNLETQLTFKNMQVERKQEDSSEAKLAEMMKAKNAQIQQLLGELERIQDSYQQKCTRYEQEITHIHAEKENAIVSLKQSKRELQVRVQEIEKDYQGRLQQKEKEKEAIVQKMLEQRAIQQVPQQEDIRSLRPENKRNEFIARLKFANAYYHNK